MVSSSGACCRILSWVVNPRGAAHPHNISICQMWSCCRENEGKELVACNGVTDYAAVVCHCSLISRFCSVQKWTAPHVSLIMLLWFVIVHWYSDSVVFRNGQLHTCHLSPHMPLIRFFSEQLKHNLQENWFPVQQVFVVVDWIVDCFWTGSIFVLL